MPVNYGMVYDMQNRYVRISKASKDYNLLSSNLDVAGEWHPKKNEDKQPERFTPGSNKGAWWQCKKNPEHEWEAVIASRTLHGNGCPYCSG